MSKKVLDAPPEFPPLRRGKRDDPKPSSPPSPSPYARKKLEYAERRTKWCECIACKLLRARR